MTMTQYCAYITEGPTTWSCSHLHGSISEAIQCGLGQTLRPDAVVNVMASAMGPDGLPRDRLLTEAERAELERLKGA